MASSSGTKEPDQMPPKSLSRKMTRMPTMLDTDDGDKIAAVDSELVPSTLSSIIPILRVANDIEPINPRIAYLCRFHAFEKAHNLDPTSSGRGVRQFKTYLLHRLEKEEVETVRLLARTDTREMKTFYQWFYETYIQEGQTPRQPEEMAKNYQIASVLYDVIKTVAPEHDTEIDDIAREVERKREYYTHYNILPLYVTGATSPIMELSEIKAAVNALRRVDNLPKPINPDSTVKDPGKEDAFLRRGHGHKSVHDLLDWLWLTFGFQKGNVANQREHLVLLLANIDIRNRFDGEYTQLNGETIQNLLNKIFKNYRSWCAYLHIDHNLKFPSSGEKQQLQLLFLGLYLLIWGEASNVRFMPECLCYIFHHMAGELLGILYGNAQSVSGGYIQPVHHGEEAFLREVITPIYTVMRKESLRNKGGTASHSKWRNYDDLNEYFWSKDCLKLDWPMKPGADFFIHTEETNVIDEVLLRCHYFCWCYIFRSCLLCKLTERTEFLPSEYPARIELPINN